MRPATWLIALSVTTSALGAQRVSFDRPAYRLHSIGQRLATNVRVTDASGRTVANPAMAFRVVDPTVATVTPRGEVVSRKEGLTRVWAVAGRDSASAYVMVEQRAARFAFSPAAIRIDALSARVPVRVQVSDSAGVPIPGNASAVGSCRSLNEEIASLSPAGEVIANANGATYLRCTDRGFADSVRVEVRQRPQRAQVLPSKSVSKTVGDTFTVRLRATDRLQKEIGDARVTWVSLDPRIVTIDPTTGRALAKAEGPTRVIAQLGDVADTASVFVGAPRGGGLLQAPTAPVADTTAKAVARRPVVDVTSLTLMEGETKQLLYTVMDTLANLIPDARVVIRSTDTATVMPADSGKVIGKKPGSVYVTVRYGTVVDSATISVRAKGDTVGLNPGIAPGADTTSFDPPTFDAAAFTARYQAERDSALKAITTSEQFAVPSGRSFTAAAYVGLAAHSSNQVNSATEQLVEDRSGVVFGGRGQLKPFSWMSVSGDLRLGQLTASGTIGEPMTMTEVSGDAMVYLMPWLGLGGGYAVRSEKTPIATQRWKMPRGVLNARTTFVGDVVSTSTSIFVLPGASFTGTPDDQQPEIGIGGEAGIEIRRGALDAGMFYYVEKFGFPDITGRSRIDQFSTLRLRVGFKIGR